MLATSPINICKIQFLGMCLNYTAIMPYTLLIQKRFMDDLNSQIQDAKTDEKELNQVLKKYDLDEELALELSEIDKAFHQLQIRYQSLVNRRKFFNRQ